jgi:O-acetyl-ADP-ribose deacetylase (regulator of RNase III)
MPQGVFMLSLETWGDYLGKWFNMNQNAIEPSIPLKKDIESFTGNLTQVQKNELEAKFIDDHTLNITFKQSPQTNLTIRRQDIFTSQAQVIVNAANTHLGGGGGIDGAIHLKGGAEYAKAHSELQSLYKSQYIEGHAAMISSGDLKEKYHIENVIVVAGPQGDANSSKETALYSCYFNSLVLAHEQNKRSIAFPSISTGIFGFPKDRAAAISLKAIQDFIDQYPNTQLQTISIHYLSPDPITNLEEYRNQVL